MQSKKLLTFAALGATILLPACGAFADNGSMSMDKTSMDSAGLGNPLMDAGQFRSSLNTLQDVLNQIRENNRLELATDDPLLLGNYKQQNRNLLNRALGLLTSVSKNWRTAPLPSMPNETADMRSSRSLDRMGTADAQRFANESDDTAFVRNTVWEIQSGLHADKVNGRDPMVDNRTMSMLKAAINRADNPSFRVAETRSMTRVAERITTQEAAPFVWDRSHDMTAQATPPSQESAITSSQETVTVTPTKGGTTDDQPGVEAAVTPSPSQTAEAPAPATSEETVTTDRTGTADLPKTGGDPAGMLVLFGSSFIGLGALLRRKQ